ncbi:hypothetical protein HPB51_021098 [Rhipicephalus microplus]|uniref:Kinesin motor domain-containing protein n=1 Tax=Rhipicephalus microplus TaxID=6941 RepID=A0A9J6EIB7_RHIMP|nr:hypothetical protein HPB51_021098 [Rhipicephalus microplus]
MIACVYPCYGDLKMTLNTLKYSNMTKNIQNRITGHQEKSNQGTKRTRTAKEMDAEEDTAESSGNEYSDSKVEELEEDETFGKNLATLTTEISFNQKLIL